MAPDNLIRKLRDPNTPPWELTYLAEEIGDVPEPYRTEVEALLVSLVTHDSLVVREGALYGLGRLDSTQALRDVAADEGQATIIRRIAQDLVSE
jgi:hypothetical protein